MVREKKGGYQNRPSNKNKNIVRQSPQNQRGKEVNHKKNNNQKVNNKKSQQTPNNQFQMPPLKVKPPVSIQPPNLQSNALANQIKKVTLARPEQVQEVLSGL